MTEQQRAYRKYLGKGIGDVWLAHRDVVMDARPAKLCNLPGHLIGSDDAEVGNSLGFCEYICSIAR